MSQARYPHLLAPGRIGTMELRNRIVVMAMGVSLAEEDGTVGDRALAYHEEQAKGGAGLIISGATGVAWPVAAVQKNQLAISDDRFIPACGGWRRRSTRMARSSASSSTRAGWSPLTHCVGAILCGARRCRTST